MDKEFYRLVPYRFFLHHTEADICKLEKLTNLFPEMKKTIELELFKSNNLSRLIERLSTIYSCLTALDIRDDTMHLFLGPYHLSLGPALFAAFRFRNISKALLAASTSHTNASGTAENRRKRRHDAVLRRFRRLGRKLILLKSILDQMCLPSVLTPYNQYELSTNGIYDLVLAGQGPKAQSMFNGTTFTDEVERLRPMNHPEEKSFLLASSFIKINTLLHLLSSSNQSDTNNRTMTTNVTDSLNDQNQSTNPLIDTATDCCFQHRQYSSLVMMPMKQPVAPQSTQMLNIRSRSSTNSNSNPRPSPSILSRQNTATSLSESIHSSDESSAAEETLIKQISSLLTNYQLTQKLNIDDLLRRVKNSVQENLARDLQLKTQQRRRQKLFAQRTTSYDEVPAEHRFSHQSKSQSCDEINSSDRQ